jgi:peptide-methionine (S)-S-oxide reductase
MKPSTNNRVWMYIAMQKFFMSLVNKSSATLLPPSLCLPGRSTLVPEAPSQLSRHWFTKNTILPPYPEHMEVCTFGMGCFWCSEGHFAKVPGVWATVVGYGQGVTENPTYEEVCSGQTNHNEVVRIIFDPKRISFEELLKDFWEIHDPTTLNRQGNDVGTQYRSGIYYHSDEQWEKAEESKRRYQDALGRPVVTEIDPVTTFYPAEEYHQQYEGKPGSRRYCGLRPSGVKFPKY